MLIKILVAILITLSSAGGGGWDNKPVKQDMCRITIGVRDVPVPCPPSATSRCGIYNFRTGVKWVPCEPRDCAIYDPETGQMSWAPCP